MLRQRTHIVYEPFQEKIDADNKFARCRYDNGELLFKNLRVAHYLCSF